MVARTIADIAESKSVAEEHLMEALSFKLRKGGIAAMEERFRIDGPRFEIARGTKDYPDVFEAVPEPPERLYVIGDPSALKEGLAVVGARKATPYGLNAT